MAREHEAEQAVRIAKLEAELAGMRRLEVLRRELLLEALGGLMCAEGQSLPSDDQIIMGHVREAIIMLRVAMKEVR